MWFFDWFRDQFGNVRSYFQSLSTSLYGVPALGPYLSSPFSWIASFFQNLQTAAAAASSWSNSVYTDAARIFQDTRGQILAAFPVLSWSSSQFFDQVRGYIGSTWGLLSWSSGQFFTWIRGSILAAFPVLSWSSGQVFEWIRGSILGAFPVLSWTSWNFFEQVRGMISSTWSILAYTKESIWSWITSGTLQQWIAAWWTGQQAAVIALIQGQLHYFIEQGFLVLNNSWSSFTGSFTWLLDKLIVLIFDQAAHFADPLWSLLEALLKNVGKDR